MFWGKGFTEWTNVGKAKPLFKGHYQPKVPADLGYYDLRLPEVREEQVNLAKYAGIEGFCYWHYWFGSGKELLERPFNEVVNSGHPNFPFCLGWANHTWSTKTWSASNSQFKETVIMEQTYPGEEDYKLHFNTYLKAFKDSRYIRVDGKLLFVIFSPLSIPNFVEMKRIWNNLAMENGLKGFYFIGIAENYTVTNNTTSHSIKKRYTYSSLAKKAESVYNNLFEKGFDAVNSRGSNRAQVLSDSPLVYYFKRFMTVSYTHLRAHET